MRRCLSLQKTLAVRRLDRVAALKVEWMSNVTALSTTQVITAGWVLAKREWIRFFRQRNRVVAAICQPLLFWMLFGTGLRGSFESSGGESFSEFFLPGTVALIVLFTAIFATISVIEDRREGFLQSVLVAPVGRLSILMGKIVGGGAIALVQALAFVIMTALIGVTSLGSNFIPLVLLLSLLAIAMCGLGMIVAWPMNSTQGFHAVMMLGLMPMWLLAGTFFPIGTWQMTGPTGTATWGSWLLTGVMRANPLSYTIVELRRLMSPALDWNSAGFSPSSMICWAVTVVATLVIVALAWVLIRQPRRVDALN